MNKDKNKDKKTDQVKMIPLDEIKPNPYQPRMTFDKGKIQELADSFESVGMVQDIVVRPHGKGYQIAVGERRWRAAKVAKLPEIRAVVRDMDDKALQLCSIAENVHRENLSSIEQETAIYKLWTKHYEPAGISMSQMSRELGKSETFVVHIVSGYERRNALDLVDDSAVTTYDIRLTKSMDEGSAKDLLKAKADGKIDARQLESIAPTINRATPVRRKTIVEQVIKAGELKQKYDKDVVDAAEAHADGYDGPTRIERSADARQLDKFVRLRDQVRWWGIEEFRQITDPETRKRAVEAASDAGDYLLKLTARARKEDQDDET